MNDLTTGRRPGVINRLLASDQPVDLAHAVAVFAVFGVTYAVIRRASAASSTEFDRPVLLVGAAMANPLPFAILAAGAGLAVALRHHRVWCQWSALEGGRVMRNLMAPVAVVLAWQGSLYGYNFVLDSWNAVDRMLVVALAVACWFRPVFLVPLALQSLIIAHQFVTPLESVAGQNIDSLPVLVLVAIAAGHLWFIASGRSDTSPVVLVISAALATHFFLPGKSKLGLDWVTTTDLSNLSLSSYTAGWRGQGDGAWSRQLADLLRPVNRLVLAGTMLVELSAIVAVVHHRVFRLWLPCCVAFHTVLFAITGFWFGWWVVIEVALFVMFTRPGLQSWLGRNATPARALVMVAAVGVGGSPLFHPLGLAWLDASVSYGYRVEAISEYGERQSVPVAAFAPYEQELAFIRARFLPTEPLSAAYGAVGSVAEFHQLQALQTFDEVEALEGPSDPELVRRSQEFIVRFVDHVNDNGAPPWWSVLSPPDHFWTGASAPTFDLDEPIARLEVFMLTAIHDGGEPRFRRRLVLAVTTGDDGSAAVTFPDPAGG